jgi:hypothetical protein
MIYLSFGLKAIGALIVLAGNVLRGHTFLFLQDLPNII